MIWTVCNQFYNRCEDSIWLKHGDVVIFYCKWRDANFNGDSLQHAVDMIKDECANGNGGSYSNDEESKRSYSYGVTNWKRHGWCNLEAGSQF